MMRGRFSRWIVAGFLLISAGTAMARVHYERPSPGVPDQDGVIWDSPIYDPVSKRYFALNWVDDWSWAQSFTDAKSHEYKGVRGRLAIIDSLEVHEFLARTFHPTTEVWIGLYYLCASRKLVWSNGEAWKSGFQVWDKVWKQDVYACKSDVPAKDFMPVAYSATDNGFRWIGKGKGKRYHGYFIEYPTGQP